MKKRKKVCSETNSERDRISELPEHLQHHILSYLTTIYAVRTCILSSSWRAVWTSLTCFRLDGDDTSSNKDNLSNDEKMIKKFFNFVYRVLGSITKLEELELNLPTLAHKYELNLKSHLDHWVDSAVGFNVKKLSLDLKEFRYRLPKIVLSCKSITNLSLWGCELNLACLTDTALPSLIELRLGEVYLDADVLERLLANCSNLQSFACINCDGLARLKVLGLTKLERVVVVWMHSVEINAPNLLEFSFHDSDGEFCKLEVSSCKNMKRLELRGVELYDDHLFEILHALPLLEELTITECHCLCEVEILSQQLVSLTISSCCEISKVKADTTKLKNFSFFGELPISFVSTHSSAKSMRLACACLTLTMSPSKELFWCSGLIKLLAKFGQSEKLSLDFADIEDFIIPESVRMKSRPPLYGVKQLQVKVRFLPFKDKVVEFIGSLLQLAPCPESITICYSEARYRDKVLKFNYERPSKRRKSCGCWKSLPTYCWRHSLSQVLLETPDEANTEHWYLVQRHQKVVDAKLAKFFQQPRIDGKMVSFVKVS